MATILSIQSSINGEASVSRRLSAEIIDQLQRAHPGIEVVERDLNLEPLPHFTGNHFSALRTPESERSHQQTREASYANELVEELFEADYLVIGVPFYNFNIPSTLKSWLDHIAVPGKTFTYKNEQGFPEGLVKGKKVFLAFALGGVYSQEPMKGIDQTEPYLRSFLGFLGMKDMITFRAEGLAIPGLREKNLQEATHEIEEFAY